MTKRPQTALDAFLLDPVATGTPVRVMATINGEDTLLLTGILRGASLSLDTAPYTARLDFMQVETSPVDIFTKLSRQKAWTHELVRHYVGLLPRDVYCAEQGIARGMPGSGKSTDVIVAAVTEKLNNPQRKYGICAETMVIAKRDANIANEYLAKLGHPSLTIWCGSQSLSSWMLPSDTIWFQD